jgi:hypothetical protein
MNNKTAEKKQNNNNNKNTRGVKCKDIKKP